MRSRRPRTRSDRPASPKPSTRLDVPARLELIVWTLLVAALVFASSTTFTIEYTLPKLMALYFATPLLLLLWIRRHLRHPIALVPTAVAAFALGAAGWWVVTSVTAVHPYTALNGAHGRFTGLWLHLCCLTLFGLGATTSLTRAELDARLRITVVALIGAAVIALAQSLGGNAFPGGRPIATIGNAVVLGACLLLAVPLAIGFAVRARKALQIAWGVSALILVAGLAATGSRGPVAGLMVSLALMAFLVARDWRLPRSWLVVICAGVAGLAIAGASYARRDAFVPSLSHLAAAASSRDRLNTMRTAAAITRDHPLLGVGFDNFSVVYPRYRTAEADRQFPDELPTMVHSGYLQLAATTGLTGLVLYLALLVSVLATVVRAMRQTADREWRILLAALLASLAAYVVADVSGWEEVSLTALFWMLLGLASTAASGAIDRRSTAGSRARILTVSVAAAWMIVVVVLAARLTDLARADRTLRQIHNASDLHDWDTERARADEVLTAASDASAYVDAVGIQYGVRYGNTGQQPLYVRAAELFETAHRLNPFDEYVLIHRVDLETAALQKHGGAAQPGAVNAAAEMDAHGWHNATADIALARFDLARGSLPSGLAAVTRARTLRPENVTAIMVEGDLLHAMHLPVRASASYRGVLSSANADPKTKNDAERRLTVCLLESGATADALAHARALVALSPSDSVAQQLLSIATAGTTASSTGR